MAEKPGDSVKIHTKEDVYSGILMPRPKLLDSNIVVLKLDHGYNMGIDKSKITKIEVIKKYDHKESKKFKLSVNKNLPTVTILSCGGTISSKIDYKTGGVIADYTAEDFVSMLPELSDIANIKAKKVIDTMSEDFLPKDWIKIANVAKKELESSDAVIITQGTDTIHFTTAALSFFLRDVNKPVIFTASQRSIDRGSSDAFMNLLCAVKTAVKFDGRGVYLVMHGSSSDDYCLIHKGTKVRKMHSLRRDAFRSINEISIGKVWPGKNDLEIINTNYPKQSDNKKLDFHADFIDKTALVMVYPGFDPKIIDFYVKEGYKGIVIAATALGHVATYNEKNLMDVIENATKKGVSIVIATQCLYGRVDPLVYSPLRELSIKRDVIFAEDMLPETAYVKLGYVLSKTSKKDEIKKLMLTNIAGEINFKRDQRAFLN